MKFFIKDFFSKCDQIRKKLRTWSHLLRKPLKEIVLVEKVLQKNDFASLREIIRNTFNSKNIIGMC